MLNKLGSNTTIAVLVIVSLIVSGCSGLGGAAKGTNYLYSYVLSQPVSNSQLFFRDNYIIVQFSFDASAISFQLQNISEASMSIVWEKVSLSVNKRTYAVRNTGTFYSVGSVAPTSPVIPPLGYIRETIIPQENVYIENGKWVEKDLLLTNDRGSAKIRAAMMKLVGSEIRLNIPIKIADIEIDYPFVFKVGKVTPLPSHLLPPVKDRPPVPKQTMSESGSGSTIIPVFIAAGVLGVAIFLLSQEKTPPADL